MAPTTAPDTTAAAISLHTAAYSPARRNANAFAVGGADQDSPVRAADPVLQREDFGRVVTNRKLA